MADDDTTELISPPEGETEIEPTRTPAQAMEQDNALARKVAIAEAGVNIGTALGKMFATAYTGPLDAASIEAAAREVGAWDSVGEQSSAPTGSGTRQEFAGTGEFVAPEPEDPYDVIRREAAEAAEKGFTPEQRVTQAFKTLAAAGRDGDVRVNPAVRHEQRKADWESVGA